MQNFNLNTGESRLIKMSPAFPRRSPSDAFNRQSQGMENYEYKDAYGKKRIDTYRLNQDRQFEAFKKMSEEYSMRVNAANARAADLIKGMEKRAVYVGEGPTRITYKKLINELKTKFVTLGERMNRSRNERYFLISDLEVMITSFEGRVRNYEAHIAKQARVNKNGTNKSVNVYRGYREAIFGDKIIAAAEADLKQSKQELKDAKEALKIAEQAKKDKRNDRNAFRGEVSTARTEATTADGTATTAESSATDAEGLLGGVPANEIIQKEKDLQKQFTEAKKAKDQAQGTLTPLEATYNAKKTNIDGQIKAIADPNINSPTAGTLKLAIDSIDAQYNTAIQGLDPTVPANKAQIDAAAATKVLETSKKKKEAAEQIAALNKELADVKEPRDVAASELTAASNEITRIDGEITTMGTQLANAQDAMSKRQEATEKRREANTKKTAADTKQDVLDGKVDAVEKAKKAIETADAKRKTMKQNRNKAIASVAKAQRNVPTKEQKKYEVMADRTLEAINKEGSYLWSHFRNVENVKTRMIDLLEEKTTILLEKMERDKSKKNWNKENIGRFLIALRNEQRYLEPFAATKISRLRELMDLEATWSMRMMDGLKIATNEANRETQNAKKADKPTALNNEWRAIYQELAYLKEHHPDTKKTRINDLNDSLEKVFKQVHKPIKEKTDKMWDIVKDGTGDESQLNLALAQNRKEALYLRRNGYSPRNRCGELYVRNNDLILRIRDIRGEELKKSTSDALKVKDTQGRMDSVDTILVEARYERGRSGLDTPRMNLLEARMNENLEVIARNTDTLIETCDSAEEIREAVNAILKEGAFLNLRFRDRSEKRIRGLRTKLHQVVKMLSQETDAAKKLAEQKRTPDTYKRVIDLTVAEKQLLDSNGYLRDWYKSRRTYLVNTGMHPLGDLKEHTDKAITKAQKTGSKRDLEKALLFIRRDKEFASMRGIDIVRSRKINKIEKELQAAFKNVYEGVEEEKKV